MKTDIKIAFLISLVFFLACAFTLPDYNINWDAVNHWPRGQAYLRLFLTGKRDYSAFPPFVKYWQRPESLFISSDVPLNKIPTRSVYQYDDYTLDYFLKNDGYGHPPISDILSSFFNLVLFQNLRIINDIDSYRVYGVFLSSLLVGLVYWWGAKKYGKLAGLVASLSLSLYPLFWAQTHFNTEKDIPELVFYSFFVFSIWKGVTAGKFRWVLLSGLFLGLGLGTKLNIIFSALVVIPWVLLFLKTKLKFLLSLFIVPIFGFLIFFIGWPYLWQDPVGGIFKMVKFYQDLGFTQNVSRLMPVFGINTYPVLSIVYVTPIIILFLFLVGFVVAIIRLKKERDKVSLLLLLWFLVPVIRVSLPGTNIHGGVRQIMEFIPAMALIAGIGAAAIGKYIPRVFIIFAFFLLVFKLLQMHPYEEFYYNPLIGGLSGAKAKNFPYWGESYGSPYRKAVEWINKNAENEAEVVFAYELMPNIPGIFFRPDIKFSNVFRSGYLRHGEYAIMLNSQGVSDRSYYDMYLLEFLRPVYEAKVDGVPIIQVWKNTEEYLIKPLTETMTNDAIVFKDDSGFKLDLKEVRSLSRLEADYQEGKCTNLERGLVRISEDGINWNLLPGTLPDDWRVAILGEQPKRGRFIEPFVGQRARYIFLDIQPNNACLKNIKKLQLYYFE